MHILSRIGRLQRASEEAILCARVADSIIYYRDVAHALGELIKKTPAEGALFSLCSRRFIVFRSVLGRLRGEQRNLLTAAHWSVEGNGESLSSRVAARVRDLLFG